MASSDCWLCCREGSAALDETLLGSMETEESSGSTLMCIVNGLPFAKANQAHRICAQSDEDAAYDAQLREQEHIIWAELNGLPPIPPADAPFKTPPTCTPHDTGPFNADVMPTQRAAAVDWMVDAAWQLVLPTDTLFLGVSLLDRYLAAGGAPPPLSPAQLQLLSLTCLWVAAKYEQASSPRAQRFLQVLGLAGATPCMRRALQVEMVAMERCLLQALHHRVGLPTIKTFLRRSHARAQHLHVPRTAYCMSAYLSELALLDSALLAALPSAVAASCYVAGAALVGGAALPPSECVIAATGYRPEALTNVVARLFQLHCAVTANPRHCAVWAKYSTPNFMGVALMPSYPLADASLGTPPHTPDAWPAPASPSPPPTPPLAAASPYAASSRGGRTPCMAVTVVAAAVAAAAAGTCNAGSA